MAHLTVRGSLLEVLAATKVKNACSMNHSYISASEFGFVGKIKMLS